VFACAMSECQVGEDGFVCEGVEDLAFSFGVMWCE